MIQPTVGRVVLYHPSPNDGGLFGDALASIITHVHNDTQVNLAVFDPYGVNHGRVNVFLDPGGSDRPPGHWAEWMPYQKGQAAKTEELEKKVAEVVAPVVSGL